MKRTLLISAFLLGLSACQLPPEASRMPALPETVTPRPYTELLERARNLARVANEAFYLDKWDRLQLAAEDLELTAKYLARAEDVPPKHADTLATMSRDLGKLATALLASARAKDAKKANETMARINATVREMRLSEIPPAKGPPPPSPPGKGA